MIRIRLISIEISLIQLQIKSDKIAFDASVSLYVHEAFFSISRLFCSHFTLTNQLLIMNNKNQTNADNLKIEADLIK